MRFEFFEDEELAKISDDEWEYICDFVCEGGGPSRDDWNEEKARNLQLYGRGGDLIDEIKSNVAIGDSIFDFYEEEFGHPVYPGDDDAESRELQRTIKFIDRFIDDLLYWYFALNADAVIAHKNWIANTEDVQEYKRDVLGFRKGFKKNDDDAEDSDSEG